MAKKRLTENQKEWNKQAKRIQRFIKSAMKRGYTFDDFPFNIDADLKIIKPKRITKKQLNTLKSFTPKVAYSKAKYLIPAPTTSVAQEVYLTNNIEFNKIVTGTEGRKLERKISSEKTRRTKAIKGKAPQYDVTYSQLTNEELPEDVYSQGDEVLQEVLNLLTTNNRTNPNPQSDAAINMLVSAYQNDPNSLLNRLANAPSEIVDEAQGLIYPSNQEERERHLMRFIVLINSTPLTATQAQQLSEQYYDTM